MTSLSKKKSLVSLLISDVDGTLVTRDKVVTPQTKTAVSRLRAAGIAFSIASSRPVLGLKQLILDLEINIAVGALNGGVIIRPDLSVISSRHLQRRTVVRALELFREHGLSAWLYTEADWFILDSQNPQVEREAWVVQFNPTVCNSFDPLLDRTVKIVGVSSGHELKPDLAETIRNALPCNTAVTRSDADSLDVTHHHATKGCVVEFLSRNIRIPMQAIATIGDMPNDVSMFNRGGISIAMGNAEKEVQAQATFVTSTNDEDGFSKAVGSFVLPDHALALAEWR